ncbi:MAG: hypothetical protein EZS28_041435, partial [Streblomastix strix]
PIITPLIASEIKDKGNISIEVQGTSLIGCKRIQIKVSEKPTSTNEEVRSITYLLEKIATQWDNDLTITGTVPEDDKIVKKGKNVQIQILVGETEDTAIPAQGKDGSEFEAVNINEKNKGVSLRTILIIVGSVLGVLLVFAVSVIIMICIIVQRTRSEKERKAYLNSRVISMDDNHW